MKDEISGIYIIKNTISNKCYIGQSQDVNFRIKMHKFMLRAGKHSNIHLQNAWNLYGESVFDFSILEECPNELLNEREIYYINMYDTYKNGYNRTIGGGGLRGYVMSPESRAKMRESHFDCASSNHPQAKQIVLLNTGELFDCIKDGAIKYKVTRCDISKNAKGKLLSAGEWLGQRLVWMYPDDYNKLSTIEIDSIVERAQHRPRGKMNYKAKAVLCIDTMERFDTITEAALKYGINNSCISAACQGKRQKHAGVDNVTGKKLSWCFIE